MLLPIVVKVLAAGLTWMGFEYLAPRVLRFHDIPTGIALGAVAIVLLSSVVASLIWPKRIPMPEVTPTELDELGIGDAESRQNGEAEPGQNPDR
jgi:hypothetical protein